jgi:hypothetical protein
MINLTDLSDEFASPATPAATASNSIAAKFKATLAAVSNAIVDARQQQAEQLVRNYLVRQDDAGLAHLGMTADEIRSVRAGTWRGSRL